MRKENRHKSREMGMREWWESVVKGGVGIRAVREFRGNWQAIGKIERAGRGERRGHGAETEIASRGKEGGKDRHPRPASTSPKHHAAGIKTKRQARQEHIGTRSRGDQRKQQKQHVGVSDTIQGQNSRMSYGCDDATIAANAG